MPTIYLIWQSLASLHQLPRATVIYLSILSRTDQALEGLSSRAADPQFLSTFFASPF